jgi:UPF0716 protein FxsA
MFGLAILIVPFVEIVILVKLGQTIGVGWTVLLLVVDAVIGSLLVRHEGRRAWNALSSALQQGRMPARELADGALVLVGGTLLLTPGFVTDVFGLICVIPFTRPLARRVLAGSISRRMTMVPGGFGSPGFGPQGFGPGNNTSPGPDVVPGDVVDD